MPDGSTVLDLACGDGELLSELIAEKHVRGSGVEIDQAAVEQCIGRGLSVFHGDLDAGLADFDDQSHDVVILSLSLQQLRRPRMIVREMVRVGRLAIVSFPNFAHWVPRSQLLARGRMPVSRDLPYQWWDTPNIHLCTIERLPRAVSRGGPLRRARAVPAFGGEAAAGSGRRAQSAGTDRDLRRHPLLTRVDPGPRRPPRGGHGARLSSLVKRGYTTPTFCVSETGASGTRSASRHTTEHRRDALQDQKENKVPQGKVKWFSTEKAFGFIEQENDNDIFVHVTGLADGVTAIDKDQLVEYEVEQGRKGPQATNCTARQRAGRGGRRGHRDRRGRRGRGRGRRRRGRGRQSRKRSSSRSRKRKRPSRDSELLTGRPPEDRSGSGGRPVVVLPPSG